MYNSLRLLLAVTFFLSGFAVSSAQDTLVLLNGRQLIADSILTEGLDVSLFSNDPKPTQWHNCPGCPKLIKSYQVFSIRHADGNEEIIYQKDPYDPLDFSENEMRMFIRGEQDADRYYHPKFSTGLSVAVGAASSYFAIYGLLLPPLYSTVIGSFTPNMDRMKVSDESLRSSDAYSEGYQSRVRRKKIRNSLIGGMAGFVAGFFILNVVAE